MNRGMGAAMQAELAETQNEPIHLFTAELDSGTYRFTDSHIAITWDGETWGASGDLLSYDGIKENADLQVSQTTVTLSGVRDTTIAAFLADDYLDRRLKIYKAMLNADGTAMEPELIFDGRMDGPVIEENPAPDEGTCTIAIPATSHFGDFERRPGRRTNSNVQQLHYPGDLFFEFNSQIPANKQSVWGRANA